MKRQLLILSLLLTTTTFSSLSFGEWKLVTTNTGGTEFYLDFDKIRIRGGFVYWTILQNRLKPSDGILSSTIYTESDCRRRSYTSLSYSFYAQAMGKGEAEITNSNPSDLEYPSSGSPQETLINEVCDYANLN